MDADLAKKERPENIDHTAILRQSIATVIKTLKSPEATIAQKYESAQSLIEHCTFDKENMLLTVSYKLNV